MKYFLLSLAVVFSGMSSVWAQNVTSLKIGPGDEIQVLVEGSPELSVQTFLAPDGSVNLPLLGKIFIDEKTSREAEKIIERKLIVGGFLRKPKVMLTILNSVRNQVTILGNVTAPGKYPINTNNETLIDLLALSGGLIAKNDVVIIRNIKNKPERLRINVEDLLLKDKVEMFQKKELFLVKGDVVFVKPTPVFYTFGETGSNSEFVWKDNLILMQALAMAGGLSNIADDDAVKIKRLTANGTYKELDAEMDTLIKENDIIIVKESLF